MSLRLRVRPARVSGGSVPFDLLYGLVSSDGTYIDVHPAAHPAGARGRVTVTNSSDWFEVCD